MAFAHNVNLPRLKNTASPLKKNLPLCSLSLQSHAKTFSRRAFLAAIASAAGSVVATAATNSEAVAPAIQYKVVKAGSGPAPEVGDLIGIRFKGMYNGVVFDNLFENTTPYFYRVGSGSILKVRPIPSIYTLLCARQSSPAHG